MCAALAIQLEARARRPAVGGILRSREHGCLVRASSVTFAERGGLASCILSGYEVMETLRSGARLIGVLVASVFQRCKRDAQDRHYPCERPRCGHAWTVRYREPGGRSGRQREKSFLRRIGLDGADAFATGVEKGKKAHVFVAPARGAMALSVWAEDWLERRVIGEATRRNYEGFVRNHVVPRLGSKPLAGLARRDFEKFVKDIYRGGAGLAAPTVNDRMVMVVAIMEAAVVDKRITENPARGIQVSRRDALAVDEDEVPTSAEVDLIAAHIVPRFRLTVFLQSGTGQRPSEALAFSTECRRPDYVRIRWQVSAKAHREDCQRPFVPLKHRLEKEYRDVPTALFVEEEIGAPPEVETGARRLRWSEGETDSA